MRLTRHTEYALRVLIHLSIQPEARFTLAEIAERYGISRNHLVKVVNNLTRLGYVRTWRGKKGGMTLALPPEAINIGEVVRHIEPNIEGEECFIRPRIDCPIELVCVLKKVLNSAQKSFLAVLSSYSLADLVDNRDRLALLIGRK